MKHVVIGVLLFLCASIGGRVYAAEPLKVEARFGFGTDGSWNVDVSEFPDFSGAMVKFSFLSAFGGGGLSGEFLLKKDGVVELKKVIEAERFFELPDSVGSDIVITGASISSICIELNSASNRVSAFSPYTTLTDKESVRFKKVWNKIVESMPQLPGRPSLAMPNKSKLSESQEAASGV